MEPGFEYCPVVHARGNAVIVAQLDPAGQMLHVRLPANA